MLAVFILLSVAFGTTIEVTASRSRDPQGHYCLPLPQYNLTERSNGINQCVRKECPQYVAIPGYYDNYENVTVRQVEAGVYAYRTSDKCDMSDALIDSYLPLHYYFYRQPVKMNRTIPILLFSTKMPEDHACNYTHQLNFYLPMANHSNYPQPTSESGVGVPNNALTQPTCYVVYHWSGKVNSRTVYSKYEDLKNNITNSANNNLSFDENRFAHARYDPSCRPGNRNEIWIPLSNCPDTDQ